MSTAYLASGRVRTLHRMEAHIHIGRFGHNGTAPNGLISCRIFSFQQPDFFDAINREVLEAETSWSENPEQARGIERF